MTDRAYAYYATKGDDSLPPLARTPGRGGLVDEAEGDLRKLLIDTPPADALLGVLVWPPAELDLETLRGYLADNSNLLSTTKATAGAKAVCLYERRPVEVLRIPRAIRGSWLAGVGLVLAAGLVSLIV